MSKYFKRVFTVEKSSKMYKIAEKNLSSANNIKLFYGDSRKVLSEILNPSMNNILFWLDAHWSGGETYGQKDECPLLDELRIIFENFKIKNRNFVILIDDARLFLAPPPLPHIWKNWPTIVDIVKIIPKDLDLLVYNDVIYIYPISISIEFRNFIQELVTHDWRKQDITKNVSFLYGIKIAIKSLIRGKILGK